MNINNVISYNIITDLLIISIRYQYLRNLFFAIYGSEILNGNQLEAILCRKWWRVAYNSVQ